MERKYFTFFIEIQFYLVVVDLGVKDNIFQKRTFTWKQRYFILVQTLTTSIVTTQNNRYMLTRLP